MEKFRFKKNAIIGAADADEDSKFLKATFIDTGVLSILRDCNDHRSIVLGRTGAGKTALLNMLYNNEEHTIRILPESLSLSYISNSNILNFVSKAGVKIDILFRLLWRHIITVELLKTRYKINDEKSKKSFIQQMFEKFVVDKKKQKAIEYLIEWGESFWKETEYRIKEVTTKLESDLKGAIQAGGFTFASLTAESAEKLSKEQKAEVIQRAQEVVNKVQIRELSSIIDILAEDIFTDPQQRYFVIIDKLDEDWVDDNIRYRLIRALIETVRDFHKVKYFKIAIALRTDLIERVFRFTRDSGFQEEKYESIFLNLLWDKENLTRLLDSRIDYMVKQQYTDMKVTHKDILPKKYDDKTKSSMDYIMDRTMMRPRDIILFFNTCIRFAENDPVINKSTLSQAEGEYSRSRLRALADEWYVDYPDLQDSVIILKKRPFSFVLNQIEDDMVDNFCLEHTASHENMKGIVTIACGYLDGKINRSDFKREIFGIYYKIGLVGFKTESFSNISWVYEGVRPAVSSSEISDDTKVYIHKGFWRVLGTY